MSTTTAPITVAQFMEMDFPEGQKAELIGGELITMGRAGYPHETVKGSLMEILAAWTHEHRRLATRSETPYQVDSQNCLVPDVSIIVRSRSAPGTQGFIQGAPEIAIEIVSSEAAARLEEKIELYLQHGSQAVWVVYPERRTVMVHDANGTARRLTEKDTLETSALLAGFGTPIAAIFEGI